MNKFKNMNKKKSFWNTLFNEFFGTILITFIIIYITRNFQKLNSFLEEN